MGCFTQVLKMGLRVLWKLLFPLVLVSPFPCFTPKSPFSRGFCYFLGCFFPNLIKPCNHSINQCSSWPRLLCGAGVLPMHTALALHQGQASRVATAPDNSGYKGAPGAAPAATALGQGRDHR